MAKPLSEEAKQNIDELIARARAAQAKINDLDQESVDRAIRAVAWATANEKTFTRLAQMGVDESGLGDREGRPNKRFKIMGILRDCLRQKSVGIIEEIPEKGLVKYAKPIGVIASLIPTTNPALTPPGVGIYALKARNAVVFAPHPRSRQTTIETINVMRAALKKIGLPEDLYVCVEHPSIPSSQYLMSQVDLSIATGGPAMVKAAYSSGKPAYGVGAGNATMVFDETTAQDVKTAAANVRTSKLSDFGSGCSADGNLLIHDSVYAQMLQALQAEGGYLCNAEEKAKLTTVLWDDERHRTMDTIACAASKIAEKAGFTLPAGKAFLLCEEDHIGPEFHWCSEKLGPIIGVFKYSGTFDKAIARLQQIYAVGGIGHSCGIYSFNDEHVHQLALAMPVSRMMVRQAQSKANSGSFTNGMPMTSSMGCGTWGGNITNENVSLKHYINVTWVSRPIPEDRPSDAELFGEFNGDQSLVF